MITKKLSETGIMENAHGVDARNLYSHENAMITIITLQPGQALKRHITPVDVAFYVLSGTGTVEIGEEKQVDDIGTKHGDSDGDHAEPAGAEAGDSKQPMFFGILPFKLMLEEVLDEYGGGGVEGRVRG